MKPKQPSILIVDDDADNRDMLSRRLIRNDFAITTAENGQHAQDLIEAQQYDLIILDVMMPDINGLDVLRWLRGRKESENIPVIMATAKHESKDIVEALEFGANDYVTKPIDFPILLARIKTQLSSKSALDTLRKEHQYLKQRIENRTGDLIEATTSLQRELYPVADVARQSERKYVTVLFSDLSGFTAMSELLDPEEVKEIMSRVLSVASEVIREQGGVLEKFLGDAVMAVFGMNKIYEDDPIRAIKAAMDIHERVNALNTTALKQKLNRDLSMHSGINTGVVVTGSTNFEEGKESILGDTVNVAARLTSIANSGEIVVGSETYKNTVGHYNFEVLEAATVKGKRKPVSVYKVISLRQQPTTIHRLTGLGSSLIGRNVELLKLEQAVENLLAGNGTTILLHGPVGTGKSRLIEEFRKGLVSESLQWFQGDAYSYTQGIPYSLFVNLLKRTWLIKESDPVDIVRQKLEQAVELLTGSRDIVPYLGRLFALDYPELKSISPQFWKSKFVESIQIIFEALSEKTPAIICLENVHWADKASHELIRTLIKKLTNREILICSFTTPFNLLENQSTKNLHKGNYHQEIELADLSFSEVQSMTKSLLDAKQVPIELLKFIETNIGGNPFYLEEFINTLVESEVLVNIRGNWQLNRPIRSTDISSTVHGVISARLDRLNDKSKRVVQEAAVIGRSFPYKILERVTEHKDALNECLNDLEHSDFIRMSSSSLQTEYFFKHVLTQEAVHSSLLKSERAELHKRVAQEIESNYSDRLPEFYEALAHHYRLAEAINETVKYLVLSAEKSLDRFAVEEAHQYFKEAFHILTKETQNSIDAQCLLIDLLIKWAITHFFRGDFKGLLELLSTHMEIAKSIHDQSRLGLFYAWYGKALYYQDKNEEAHQYLSKALEVGDAIKDSQIIGYACSSLLYTSKERGLFDEAIIFGERALEVSKHALSDPVIYTRSLVGLGDVYFFTGQVSKIRDSGNALFEYARNNNSNDQAATSAHVCIGLAHLCSGDISSAIISFENARSLSVSPFFTQWPKLWLGNAYILNNQMDEAENVLNQLVEFCRQYGVLNLELLAEGFLGIVMCYRENPTYGLDRVDQILNTFSELDAKTYHVYLESLLGKTCLHISQQMRNRGGTISKQELSFLDMDKQAEIHLQIVVDEATTLGAMGLLGSAYFDISRLYKLKEDRDKAKEFTLLAIEQFQRCGAKTYLEITKKELLAI